MNLFVLDHDVEENVRCHVDSHVHKIALECTQVLSTALFLRGEPNVAYDAAMWHARGMWQSAARHSLHRAFLPTHLGPLANWCRDPVNYMWALRYGVELCKEHQHRKGTVVHTWHVLSQLPRYTVHRAPSAWYAAVPDDLVTAEELLAGKLLTSHRIVEVYRQYYCRDKSHLHKWTNRGEPIWLSTN